MASICVCFPPDPHPCMLIIALCLSHPSLPWFLSLLMTPCIFTSQVPIQKSLLFYSDGEMNDLAAKTFLSMWWSLAPIRGGHNGDHIARALGRVCPRLFRGPRSIPASTSGGPLPQWNHSSPGTCLLWCPWYLLLYLLYQQTVKSCISSLPCSQHTRCQQCHSKVFYISSSFSS